MKWAARLGGILAVMVLTALTASPGLAQEPEFCWKDSYGRGVGTIPSYSLCPSGMRDDGLFCRRAEYGRGGGYAWEGRDGLSSAGMISRCEGDNGGGKCEMWGAIAYPKCRSGYSAFGCCICRPVVPDCGQLGLGNRVDLSCAKIAFCPGGSSDVPGSAQEMDAGLCYRGCGAGYTGVGPVCWKKPPPGWVDCGMGAAKDSATCARIVFDQVAAVGRLALTAATLGSSLAVGVKNPSSFTESIAKLRKDYTDLLAKYNAAKANSPKLAAADQAAKAASYLYAGSEAVSTGHNVLTDAPEDIARVAAQIAAVVDSSGVSATIGAYTYPKCSKYEDVLAQ